MTIESPPTDMWTQVRVDIGELKGILNTTVVTHSDKIRDLEQTQEIQRRDMNSVKDTLIEKINVVGTVASTNTNEISNLRDDMRQVQEKQNATFGKVMQVFGPIIAGLALVLSIYGKLAVS
jgi:hypothetical protein